MISTRTPFALTRVRPRQGMHQFLAINRQELIARCALKGSAHGGPGTGARREEHGIPTFLDQLTRILAEEAAAGSTRTTGEPAAPGSDPDSEIHVSARAHGTELMAQGFTVQQVVHDYGNLCQAIADLACETAAPFSTTEFRTLNRCLDNAIADAMTEYNRLRETDIAARHLAAANERTGFLVHELRNALGTATLAVRALELSQLPLSGASGLMLGRCLQALAELVNGALEEVRGVASGPQQTFSVADYIEDARRSAQLSADAGRFRLRTEPVDPALLVRGHRATLLAALDNLLQNAAKFTHPGTDVVLHAFASGEHVLIEVGDRCGGLPQGSAETLFTPFQQRGTDRSGLGLGLTIARRSVEAHAGTLSVRDVPGVGCVFTIRLPRAVARTRDTGPER
jgi:hypothetical protein